MIQKQYISWFKSGHERSIKAKRNIAALVFLKGTSIIISLILVPLTLQYLNPVQYGIWLTLSSVIAWVNFFDIGLSNGLRNKFIESVVLGDKEKTRMYVSTTYAILTIIMGVLFIVFLSVSPFLSWAKILNADPSMESELSLLSIIVFSFFGLRFIVGILNTILTADQKPAASNLLDVLGNLLSLIFIYILTLTTKGSIIYLGIAVSLSMFVAPLIGSWWHFTHEYKYYIPSLRYISLGSAKNLMNLSVQFFVIQIAGLILFMTSNIIIAQLFNPAEVTSYNIAFKYFNIITMFFSIVIAPFWSAYADAYHRNEILWIKRTTRNLVLIWGGAVFFSILMVLIAEQAYRFWIGPSIWIPLSLSIAMALYVSICNWNSIFASFINSTGKLRLQLYSSIVIGIIHIPLSILLGKHYALGSTGVVLSASLCLFIASIWSPIQYYKIINKTDKGIWGK